MYGQCWLNVYIEKKRQFNCISDLKKVIIEEWKQIDQNQIASLIGTMNKRLIEVIANGGGLTHY